MTDTHRRRPAAGILVGRAAGCFAAARADSPVRSESFSTTVPHHVLIMLAVRPVFARIYFRRVPRAGGREQLRHTATLSGAWLAAAVLVDGVGFVLIRSPWSLTPRQFSVDYQPWISLIYLSILLGPWIHLGLARLLDRPPAAAGAGGPG